MAHNHLSKDQIYNYIKVRGAQVVIDFNHDPAKNANSIIIREGVGDTNDDSLGRVEAGRLYYLCDGIWRKTDYSSSPQPGQGGTCAGENSANYILGVALGTFGEYSGTPSEVGMLLRGVTTIILYHVGYAPDDGKPIYVSAVNGSGSIPSGSMTTVSPSTSGNVVRRAGYTLKSRQYVSGYASAYETIIAFEPDQDYSLYGAGGAGGAPTDAQYVVLATDGDLSAERVLTQGDNITITDGGANAPVTVKAVPSHTNTSIQFNSGSEFSGSSKLIFDYEQDLLTLTGTLEISGSSPALFVTGSSYFGTGHDVDEMVINSFVKLSCELSSSETMSASYFAGDGSQLTNLPGGGGISWDGSTANGVATFKDADEATVESNLTFDGSSLIMTGSGYINGELEVNGTIYTPINSLTLADTINTDASTGNVFTVTLTGSDITTLANPTNLEDGATYRWIVKQDDDGGSDLLFGTSFQFVNGLPPSMLSASNGVNILEGVSDGTFVYLTSNMAVTGTAVSGSDASKKDDGAYLFDDFRRKAVLSYWYDATDDDTITKDESDLVSNWENKSEQGPEAAQSNGTEKPTYSATALNGFPGITFNGSDNMMYIGSSGDEEDLEELNVSYFIICKYDDADDGHIIGIGSSADGYLESYGTGIYTESGKPGLKSVAGGIGVVIKSADTENDDATILIRGILKPNDSSLYINGVVKGTSTTTPNTHTAYNFATIGASDGGNDGSPADFWDGTIGEIIIFSGAPLSDHQVRTIEKYLIVKWDIIDDYRT